MQVRSGMNMQEVPCSASFTIMPNALSISLTPKALTVRTAMARFASTYYADRGRGRVPVGGLARRALGEVALAITERCFGMPSFTSALPGLPCRPTVRCRDVPPSKRNLSQGHSF